MPFVANFAQRLKGIFNFPSISSAWQSLANEINLYFCPIITFFAAFAVNIGKGKMLVLFRFLVAIKKFLITL